MALNKIFIHRKDLSYSEVKESDSDITFIREDALLEWMKKEIEKWSSESNTAQGVKMGLTLILDKIKSL